MVMNLHSLACWKRALRLCLTLVASLLGSSALAEENYSDETMNHGEPIELTERAKKLHYDCLLIDGHNDMPWEIRDTFSSSLANADIAQRQPKLQTDIPRLREGGVGAQFWSVWVPVSHGYRGTALGDTIEQIKLVRAIIARYPNDFELALSTDDIERIHNEGRIASLIGVEGGHCIEESMSNLKNLYNMGARYMTLTHSDTLSWADSATDEGKSDGLNEFGVQVVKTMNDLGMLVDLSHVSVATMHDALDTTRAPVIFSHSSARAVAGTKRNVPDDVLKRLPENGGVVMVNFYSGFLVPEAVTNYEQSMALERELSKTLDEAEVDLRVKRWTAENPMPRGTIHHLLDHIDHIVEVAGVEHVGIGSDYDGVSTLPLQLEDVSTYPYVTQGLIDRGYSDDEIRAILGGNLMRVFRAAEKAAQQ